MVKKKNLIFSILCVMALMISSIGAAYASNRNIANYNKITPRNGVTYTAPLRKVGTTRAVNNNTSVGGGVRMDTAVFLNVTRVSSQLRIPSGQRITIPYNAGRAVSGVNYRLGHSTPLTTVVQVQTRGSWSPDER